MEECVHVVDAGTPLHVNVDTTDRGFITAYGPGLTSGNSGKESEFYIAGGTSESDDAQIIHTK